MLIERAAVERDLLEYEHLVDNAHAESEMQHFYQQRPYVLGAGAYETTAHPRFDPIGSPAPIFLDLVQHPFNGGSRSQSCENHRVKNTAGSASHQNGIGLALGAARDGRSRTNAVLRGSRDRQKVPEANGSHFWGRTRASGEIIDCGTRWEI